MVAKPSLCIPPCNYGGKLPVGDDFRLFGGNHEHTWIQKVICASAHSEFIPGGGRRRKASSKPEKCSSKGAWCVPSAVGEKNFGRAGSGFSELGSAMPLCWMQEKGTDMLHMLYGSLPMCWLCLCTCCWSCITILKGGVKSVFTSGAFFHHTRLNKHSQ